MINQLIKKGMAVFLSCMVLAGHMPIHHVVAADNEKKHITVKKDNEGTFSLNNGDVKLFYQLTEQTSVSKTEYIATICEVVSKNDTMQDVVIPKEFNDKIYADDESGWVDFHATVNKVVLDGYPRKNIHSITLEDGIKEFGYYCDDNNACPDLEVLNIPASCTTLCALDYCGAGNYKWGLGRFNKYFQGLKEINIDSNNPTYTSKDGVVYNKEETQLIIYPAAKENDCFTVPDSVTEITPRAFNYSKNTKKVIVSNSVDTIGIRAFGDATGLTEVQLPQNNNEFDRLESEVFSDSSIKHVKFPDSVKTICSSAISCMPELETLDLNNVSNYEEHPYGTIDLNFSYCPKLKSIDFGKLKDISNVGRTQCFLGSTSIESMTVDKDSDMEVMDGNLLKDNEYGKKLIYHASGITPKDGIYRIPDYIVLTSPYAFASNDKITQYIVPKYIEMSDGTFITLGNTPTITCLGNPSYNFDDMAVFYNCKDNTKVQFESESLVKDFNDNISTYSKYCTPIAEVYQPVATTNLSITNQTTTFKEGEDTILTTSITPSNSTDSITYESTNKDVATINPVGKIFFEGPGKVTIKATAGEQTATKEFVVKGNISKANVTLDNATIPLKDGVAAHPNVTITCNGTTLTEKTDYTLSYENDQEIGTATIIITGIGNFEGVTKKTYQVTKSFDDTTTIEVADQLWTGNQIKPQITVKDGDQLLKENSDYTIHYGENQKVGTGSVTITGIGNYSGTKSKDFNIISNGNTNLSDANVSLLQTSFTYTGSEINPKVLVYSPASGELLVENKDYTLVYTNNTNIGTGHVTIVPAPNSEWTESKGLDFEIKKAVYSNANVTLNQTSFTYNGSILTPSVTVKNPNTGATLKQGIDYTVSYANHVNAGTGTVIVTSTSNSEWQGSKTLYFTIHKANITVDKSMRNCFYNGSYQSQWASVTFDGRNLNKNQDYRISYSNNKNCGMATARIEGIGNYTGTFTRTFYIIPRKSSVSKIKVGKRSMKVTVKNDNCGAKKQIRYSYYSSMKKSKTVSIGTSKTVKKLKKGKKYYVQVRSYMKIYGRTYYTSWSSKKKSSKIK